jgi:hypothetical protein
MGVLVGALYRIGAASRGSRGGLGGRQWCFKAPSILGGRASGARCHSELMGRGGCATTISMKRRGTEGEGEAEHNSGGDRGRVAAVLYCERKEVTGR